MPEDISVVGLHDISQASWQSYRLTTNRQSVDDLIGEGMQAVLCEANPRKPLKTVLPLNWWSGRQCTSARCACASRPGA